MSLALQQWKTHWNQIGLSIDEGLLGSITMNSYWKRTLWCTGFFSRTIFRVFMFGFGALVTNLFTDMGKATVGRLRPYFITICKPNRTLLNCSQGYITEDICTGDPKDVLEARSVAWNKTSGPRCSKAR